MLIKVSVVVPVYNAAAFVTKTLESITSQTLEELEIIVVDDGSTDDSYRIVGEFFSVGSRKNLKAKILRQENLGVSAARNHGFSQSDGDYVMFFDSDDIMKPDCLEKMHEKAKSTSADIVMCGFDLVNEYGKVLGKYDSRYSYIEGVLSGKEASLMMLQKKIWLWTGSGLFSSSFLRENELRYQHGATHGEDQEFGLKALFLSNRVASVHDSLVHYVQRESSAVRKKTMNHFHYIGSMRRLRTFLSSHGATPCILELVDKIQIPESYICALASLIASGFDEEMVHTLLRTRPIAEEIGSYAPSTFKGKIKKFLLRRMPSLYFSYCAIKARRLSRQYPINRQGKK